MTTNKYLNDFLLNKSFLIYLEVNKDNIITNANEYACNHFGRNIVGAAISEIFTSSQGKLDIYSLELNSKEAILLNGINQGTPAESFLCTIYEDQDVRICLGQHDFTELMRNRKDYLNMNSEIVDLNRDLQKKSIELKRSNDQKNYYLGVASHDLRNPLTIINFCTYKLLKMPQVSQLKDAQDLVNKIKNMSAFMNKLIQDLLDITKIDSGKFELSKIETVIPEYLQPIIDLNRIIAQNKNISIESRYGENIPRIQIDQSKIEQVINNIISNAIKYSNKDKKIMISVERKEAYVIFSVQDQGQGILPEELSKLFQPFQITSTKSTDGEKSTGLGLSIIKKIIEFHKGQVWIESEFGVGSILYFSLPIG